MRACTSCDLYSATEAPCSHLHVSPRVAHWVHAVTLCLGLEQRSHISQLLGMFISQVQALREVITYVVQLPDFIGASRGVAVPTNGSDADHTVTVSHETWAEISSAKLPLADAITAGAVTITGEATSVTAALACFEHPALQG